MNRQRPARADNIPLLSLAIMAFVPALLIGGVWQFASANETPPTTTTTTTLPPEPVDPLSTALFSLRRHPSPLAERVAEAESAEQFASNIAALGAGIDDSSCMRVVDDGEVIAQFGTTGPLIPASNQKLLVAAVALDVIGPSYRFRTELQSARPANGVISGNVYLVGGGDPVLRTATTADPLRYPAFNVTELEALADQLDTLGITTIQGDLVGDGSRYDDEFRAPSWGDNIVNSDAGPYDALLVNDGLLDTGNYGLNPNRSAARVFADLLIARGISIEGFAANDARPEGAELTTLAFIESLPLTDVLVELLHTSDNNTAEMLVKEIGFQAAGEGSRDAGLRVIRDTLDRWSVPTAGLELHDGSGLSRANRATCEALVALLASPVADQLRSVMPVAGRDGTLADQLLGTDAEGRMQAKTGTLTGVKALTGTQPAGDRRPIDFSVVLNDDGANDPASYLPVWQSVIDLIGEYPVVIEPNPDLFAPIGAGGMVGAADG